MEAVSAVKMRKSQERALGGRAYAAGALRVLNHLTQGVETASHELFTKREEGALGIVIVTSDKGLAGALNSAVLKRVEAFLRDPQYKRREKVFVCIGRRGHEFVLNRSLRVVHYEENKSDTVTEEEMARVTHHILKAHETRTTASWHIAYTNFKSTFEQIATMAQLLPLEKETLTKIIDGIVPEAGKYADDAQADKDFAYTIEPSAEDILDAIIPNLVNIYVYHALLETKASEHSARMVAMKNATDKAGELAHDLMLKFNKARQAVITREVSEITSGVEAMK